MLNLPRPHVELAPTTNPFVILNHILDTYIKFRNVLRLHANDIQTLTSFTIHVNYFLEKLVVFETPTQYATTFQVFFLFIFILTPLGPQPSTNFIHKVSNLFFQTFSKHSKKCFFFNETLSKNLLSF